MFPVLDVHEQETGSECGSSCALSRSAGGLPDLLPVLQEPVPQKNTFVHYEDEEYERPATPPMRTAPSILMSIHSKYAVPSWATRSSGSRLVAESISPSGQPSAASAAATEGQAAEEEEERLPPAEAAAPPAGVPVPAADPRQGGAAAAESEDEEEAEEALQEDDEEVAVGSISVSEWQTSGDDAYHADFAPQLLPSIGSARHSLGSCEPCAWFWKPQGCRNGSTCVRCHLCPQGEVKIRKRQKDLAMKAEADVRELLPERRRGCGAPAPAPGVGVAAKEVVALGAGGPEAAAAVGSSFTTAYVPSSGAAFQEPAYIQPSDQLSSAGIPLSVISSMGASLRFESSLDHESTEAQDRFLSSSPPGLAVEPHPPGMRDHLAAGLAPGDTGTTLGSSPATLDAGSLQIGQPTLRDWTPEVARDDNMPSLAVKNTFIHVDERFEDEDDAEDTRRWPANPPVFSAPSRLVGLPLGASPFLRPPATRAAAYGRGEELPAPAPQRSLSAESRKSPEALSKAEEKVPASAEAGDEDPASLHERRECKPCAYFWFKADGCRNGESCEFCHKCDRSEIKRRKKQRVKTLKALGAAQVAFGAAQVVALN